MRPSGTPVALPGWHAPPAVLPVIRALHVEVLGQVLHPLQVLGVGELGAKLSRRYGEALAHAVVAVALQRRMAAGPLGSRARLCATCVVPYVQYLVKAAEFMVDATPNTCGMA